ncbi:hypothetical protein KAW65_05940 [candidate division WOR-3 bacterium]|nr:hypothetical protein [candidate division WOR-3 bacterium]
MDKTVFGDVLDKIDRIPLEDQNMVIEILKNRYWDRRREEIKRNAEFTMEEYRKGLTSKGDVADLIKSLEEDA